MKSIAIYFFNTKQSKNFIVIQKGSVISMTNNKTELNTKTIHYFGETIDPRVSVKKELYLKLAKLIQTKGEHHECYGRDIYQLSEFSLKEDCLGEWVICHKDKSEDYIKGFIARIQTV